MNVLPNHPPRHNARLTGVTADDGPGVFEKEMIPPKPTALKVLFPKEFVEELRSIEVEDEAIE